MIAVVQRTQEASVSINGTVKSRIGAGLMILLGITHSDGPEDVEWLSKKICHMRIFGDEDGKMNLSVQDVKGDLLVVSQFTLHSSTQKGNRPSFIEAARPEKARPLYQQFIKACELETGKSIATGEFGADMKVSLINDGPVTILIDSKNKK